jgi:hypothetical protein
MAGGLGKMLRDQPILAGCLGVLAVGALIACGGGALLVIGGKIAIDKASESAGIDGVISTAQDAATRGFAFNVSIDEDGTTYALIPLEPMSVNCDEVKAFLFPHLTGTLETVRVESQSVLINDDGSFTTVPLTCTWDGWPGKDGGGGELRSVDAPAAPAEETQVPTEEAPSGEAPSEEAEPASPEAAPSDAP